MRVSWTNGDGSGRILIARADSPVNVEPQDLVNYNATGGGYGNPNYQIGTGNYVLYQGTGTAVNLSNLDPNVTYHFALYEYNGNYGKLFLTSTTPANPAPGATASQATNAYPTKNARAMPFSSIDGNRMYYQVYNNNEKGNGDKRLVIAKQGSPVTAVPVDGIEYTGSDTFGNGHELAPGEFVVYSGASARRTLTGLQPNTTYHFKVFEFNGNGTDTYYLKTDDDEGYPVFEASQATLNNPTVQTKDIFINGKTTSSFNVNWTNGDGAGRILIARANEPVDVEPQDFVNYNASYGGYGNAYYQIGIGNYAVYAGSGVSVNVTNLQPGTNYHFALFEYNGNYGKLYLRPAYTFEAETFGERPTQQVSNASFEDVGASSMVVKFDRGSGSARMVIAREGTLVNVEPVDATTYTANGNFGQGQNLGSGNFVVFNGTAEEFEFSNLDPSSTYHFAFFEYTINQDDELYVLPGYAASVETPSPPTVIPSDFSYSRPCDDDLTINWTPGNGQGRLVVISEAPLTAGPIDGTAYTANFSYGVGDAIGNGYVIYNASGNMVPPNLLQPSTNYYVNIYEYNGPKTDPVFNMVPLEGFIGDISLPDVRCNDIQVVLDENGSAVITAEEVGVIPAGDCGALTVEIDITDFDCSHLGPNNVTLTITDQDNNSSSCVSVVTVVDQTPPTVITKNITVQLNASGTATIANDAINDGSTDACGPLTLTTDITTFNNSHIGENTVTLTATDGSNNSSSATAIVTIIDIDAPINDDLCNAISLVVGATSSGDAYTNVGATIEANEPLGSCWSGSVSKTVWFSFEAPASGNAVVSTDIPGGTLTDTHIAIYGSLVDCNDLTTLVEIGCDGNGGTIVPNNSIAALTGLISGDTYYVQVEGYNSQTGTFGIEVRDSGCSVPTNLSADVIADTSAHISWNAGNNETQWIVKYSDISTFDPVTEGMSSIVNGSPNTELVGLTSNTTYTVYVKAECGNGDQSGFAGPLQLTTPCHGNPTLSFLGTGAFVDSIVTPTQGTPETTYEFAIIYTNEAGELPPYGFPRVLLDYEGNGRFTDTNDRAVVLTAADINDLDTTDGKVYVGSISQLPSGTSWQAWVQEQSNGCTTEMGPHNTPQVLIGPDLEIFANDIVFDNMNPDVSSPLQITATIHNKSDYAAENFVVHLENQFDFTAVYPDIIVDYLDAHESTSVTWNIITPSIPSWNPMEVFVDHTNVIIESNELNNRAMRPFTNGDFNIPGAINVQASAFPSVIQLPSSQSYVTVSGHAYYTDTAVQLQDSTVAGATVTFISPVTGSTIQTHTNSRGYFSFRTPRGSHTGIYTAPVSVTDFTITGETPITWELVQGPCLPDLRTVISPSNRGIIEGESVSGTITVTNNGCAPVAVETLLEMDQTGGLPIIGSVIVPPLAPGESFNLPYTAQFDIQGTYYITGLADAENVVEESSENNNLGTATIRVNPPLPDITPIGRGSMGSQYLCSAGSTQSFGIRNTGYVPTGEFDSTIDVYFEGNLIETYTRTVLNIDPDQSTSVSIPIEYQQLGRYSFVINCDVPDDVVEISETNNSSSYYIDILECRSDLYVSSSCSDLVVDPVDPQIPGMVTYSAVIGNSGNTTALGPIEFVFTLSNGEVYPLTHDQDILPGERVTVTTSAPSVSSGETTITATVDPNSLIDDRNRDNNSTSGVLCWEFETVPLCSFNFWNTVYHENESALPTVGVRVKHLYKASLVKVRFEVKAPGDTEWAFLGDAAVQNVNSCQGCPYYAALPSRFVFNDSGIYTFRMTTDPDNQYDECDESNNVLVKDVLVQNKPDMRILSQHINPTLLNPEPGEYTFFDISYENIGYSNIDDSMDLTLMINDETLAVVNNVPGLIKDRTNTIAVPIPYSSEIEGLHVARAIIDSNHNVNDANRSNNEATRSFVVGAAANLSFNQFYASNETPEVGEIIDIDALIANNGELDVDAEILFSYISATGDTINIGTRPVSVPIGAGGGIPRGLPVGPQGGQNLDNEVVSIPWTVVETPVRIVGEIINPSELEFDYTDNFAYTQLNNYNVSLTATLACGEQNIKGTLTAVAENGTAPYSYYWSNGFMGEVLEASPGTYGVTVIDASGKRALATGTIVEDPECIVPICSLSAVSFNVPSSCNPTSGAYTTTVVVSYENPPTEGSISVNGTDHVITGSPQSFEVDFYSGPVIFNIHFTEDDNCNLTIFTGITLEMCEQDCEGIYGGTTVPGTACLDLNGNSGIYDDDCLCEVDQQPGCTSPEVTLVAQDAEGEPIEGCIHEGESYYVLAILTGGTGNNSYTVTANSEGPVLVDAEDSVVLGPFAVGTDVSVVATGVDDATCSATVTIDSPDVCDPIPDPSLDSFITTWQTTVSNETITIPTTGSGYNYSVDWGDGNSNVGYTGNATHTYETPGLYTVNINGDFPRIYFNNGGDRLKIKSIEQWGTNVWISMNGAFAGAENLISNATDMPDLSMVTDMYGMFAYARSFTGDHNFGNWDVSNVTNMEGMFGGASVFNHPIGGWNVGNVVTMENMFHGATRFNQDISEWDVSKVTTMKSMFHAAMRFNQELGNWNVGNVTSMNAMFSNANVFDQNIGGWDVSHVQDMANMFRNVTISTENYDALLNGWNGLALQDNVTFDGGNSKYCNGRAARTYLINLRGWTITDGGADCAIDPGEYFITTWQTELDNESITLPTYGNGYNYDVNWDYDESGPGTWETGWTGTANHTYPSAGTYTVAIRGSFPRIYFNNSGDRKKIRSVEQWGSNIWTSMNSAFAGAENFVSNATDMPNLTMVTDMYGTFAYARSFNGDANFGNWDVSKVTNMYGMFGGASVFDQNIGNWNVGNVTDMGSMFHGATAFNQDIGAWNVGKVTNMESMFYAAPRFNGAIGNWNVGNVTNMNSMFFHANRFDQDLGNWDVGNVANMTNMFMNVTLATSNYDALLNGWATQSLQNNVRFHGGNSKYCAGETARQLMIDNFNWTIVDGGKDCSNPYGERLDMDNNAPWIGIELYPNPMKDELVLANPGNIQLEQISIYDLTGRLVTQVDLRGMANGTIIDVSKLSSATYMVIISGKDGQTSELMIKE